MRKALIAVTLTASLITHPSLWSFVADLWNKSTAEVGCGADPWGKCNPAPETDSGCGFDPWGKCNPAPPETDSGCGADPWGCPKGS